jgi:phage-related protein
MYRRAPQILHSLITDELAGIQNGVAFVPIKTPVRYGAGQREGAGSVRDSRNYQALVAVALLVGSPAFGHHSFAMFDNDKTLTLEGTVKEFQWTNPHTWVQVMVQDPATGKSVEWSVEGGSPNGLSRQGWTRHAAKEGDKAIIVVHPLKNGSPGGSLISMTINGQKVGRQRVGS